MCMLQCDNGFNEKCNSFVLHFCLFAQKSCAHFSGNLSTRARDDTIRLLRKCILLHYFNIGTYGLAPQKSLNVVKMYRQSLREEDKLPRIDSGILFTFREHLLIKIHTLLQVPIFRPRFFFLQFRFIAIIITAKAEAIRIENLRFKFLIPSNLRSVVCFVV